MSAAYLICSRGGTSLGLRANEKRSECTGCQTMRLVDLARSSVELPAVPGRVICV
jgi:hypothetical protein